MTLEQIGGKDDPNIVESQQTLILGPEGLLLAAIFRYEKPIPIIPKFEETRKEAVQQELEKLEEREAKVLRLRFGFTTGRKESLKNVAQEIPPLPSKGPFPGSKDHVTRERIRQIEARALRKLRHPKRSAGLELFLPLTDNSIGKTTWDIDFGFKLTELYPRVDLENLTIHDLSLPEEVLNEVNNLFLAPTVIEGLYYGALRAQQFRTFIRIEAISPLSEPLQHQLRQSLERLDQKALPS